MYAIIQTGGKQYRVTPGDIVEVERTGAVQGQTFNFDQVLAITDKESIELGTPFIEGAQVSAELLEQKKGKKLVVFKMKRRKRYRRKLGHRQLLLKAKVLEIQHVKSAAPTEKVEEPDQESDD